MIFGSTDLHGRVAAQLKQSRTSYNWLGLEKDTGKQVERDRDVLRDVAIDSQSNDERQTASLALRLSELAQTGEFANVHAHEVTDAGLANVLAGEKSADQRFAAVLKPTISSIVLHTTPEAGWQFIATNGSPEGQCVAQMAIAAGKATLGGQLYDYYPKNIYGSLADTMAMGVLAGVGGPAGAALLALDHMGGVDQDQAKAATAMVRSLASHANEADTRQLAKAYSPLLRDYPASKFAPVLMLHDLRDHKPASADTLRDLARQTSFGDEWANRSAYESILHQVAERGVEATPAQQEKAQKALTELSTSSNGRQLFEAVSSL